MIKKLMFLIFTSIAIFTAFFLFYNGGNDYKEERITTGHGPEDMALDEWQKDKPRIIISCSKRKGENQYGLIQAYDINQNEVYDMTLKGYNPDQLRPHGIFLNIEDSTQFLYVISHEEELNSELIEDKILKFQVDERLLIYHSTVASSNSNELMDRTNDLFVTSNGNVYCTNPTDVGFSEVPADVVVIRPDGTSSTSAAGLLYPNGIYVNGDDMYVATAQGNKLYQYELDERGIALPNSRKEVADIVGGDNITKHEDDLIIAHHPNIYKFVFHSMWGLKSPSAVTRYNLTTGKSTIIYGPSAKDISASSTGIIYSGYLYVSQVFENYIIKVPISELNG